MGAEVDNSDETIGEAMVDVVDDTVSESTADGNETVRGNPNDPPFPFLPFALPLSEREGDWRGE
jgi:hypothetical protein